MKTSSTELHLPVVKLQTSLVAIGKRVDFDVCGAAVESYFVCVPTEHILRTNDSTILSMQQVHLHVTFVSF